MHRINHHLPFLSPHPSGNIRLAPHDLSATSFGLHHSFSGVDSDSEDSDDGLPTTRLNGGGVDTSDELPLPYKRQGAWGVVKETGATVFELGKSGWEALGWGRERGKSYRGEGERDDGIARAFWGTRRDNRVGGIRLGGGGAGPRRGGQGGLSGFSGLLERVTDVAGSRRPPPSTDGYSSLPTHTPPPPPAPTSRRTAPPSPSSRSHSRAASISSSNNGGLFELGEEDEEGHGDAVELPREFELKETRRPREVEGGR